jgi:hypothetical protein
MQDQLHLFKLNGPVKPGTGATILGADLNAYKQYLKEHLALEVQALDLHMGYDELTHLPMHTDGGTFNLACQISGLFACLTVCLSVCLSIYPTVCQPLSKYKICNHKQHQETRRGI